MDTKPPARVTMDGMLLQQFLKQGERIEAAVTMLTGVVTSFDKALSVHIQEDRATAVRQTEIIAIQESQNGAIRKLEDRDRDRTQREADAEKASLKRDADQKWFTGILITLSAAVSGLAAHLFGRVP